MKLHTAIFLLLIFFIGIVLQLILGDHDSKKSITKNNIELNIQEKDGIRTYPYTITPERKTFLLKQINFISKGMSYLDVLKIMGEPDRINYLYKRIKSVPPSGFFYSYVFSQNIKDGSAIEKKIQDIAIIFNTDLKVESIFLSKEQSEE